MDAPRSPPTQPLSHHDILGLVGPYTRGGWQLDLAASDRLARRLLLRPVPARPLDEHLLLEGLATGSWQLTRSCMGPGGLQATVQSLGAKPELLLAAVLAVPVDRHFRSGAGFDIARSYRVLPGGRAVLEKGQVRIEAAGTLLTLAMTVSAVRGVAAEIQLLAPRERLALPLDLLAVLGWHWTRLVPGKPAGQGWQTRVRLRGHALARTAAAEAALDGAAAHLAQTLQSPPARFHERHGPARFGVMLRRAIPLATPLVLVATILLMPRLDVSGHPGPWLLLYHLPTVLILLSFRMQELPTLAPPPWPRRSAAPDWREDTPRN